MSDGPKCQIVKRDSCSKWPQSLRLVTSKCGAKKEVSDFGRFELVAKLNTDGRERLVAYVKFIGKRFLASIVKIGRILEGTTILMALRMGPKKLATFNRPPQTKWTQLEIPAHRSAVTTTKHEKTRRSNHLLWPWGGRRPSSAGSGLWANSSANFSHFRHAPK